MVAMNMKISSKESGVVLIVALVIVLLTGILCLAAMRGSGLQESMAGNMRERNLAFQVTESALREGESLMMGNGELPLFNGQNGRYVELAPAHSVLTFDEDDWADNAKVKLLELELGNVAEKPAYVIEELNSDMNKSKKDTGSGTDVDSISFTPMHYRVTSRAVGVTKDSIVILQSTIKRVP